MAKKHASSTNSEKAPYQRLIFWENPSNQFWENETHTEKSKEYFRNWLADMRDREIRYVNL